MHPHCPPGCLRHQLTIRVQLPLSFFATLFGMNAQEINDGKMSMTTQLRWMCTLLTPVHRAKMLTLTVALSSMVICFSLAVAFSSWARAAMWGAVHTAIGYLVHPVRGNTKGAVRLANTSPRAIREFMIAKQKEWEGKDGNKGNASGVLPSRQDQEGEPGRPKAMMRLPWRRKSASASSV